MQGQLHESGHEPGIDTLVKRARIAKYVILATIAIFALTLAGELLELVGVINLESLEPDLLTTAYVYVLFSNSAFFLVSVVVICMWIHRAHANLHEMGHEGLEYTPGWAVGWYFIPFANLIKPFQAMRELWNESHSLSDGFAQDAPGNLGLWWGLWLSGNIVGNISTRLYLLDDGSNLDIALYLGIASSILMIGAAWLIYQIIEAVTAAQISKTTLSQVFE